LHEWLRYALDITVKSAEAVNDGDGAIEMKKYRSKEN